MCVKECEFLSQRLSGSPKVSEFLCRTNGIKIAAPAQLTGKCTPLFIYITSCIPSAAYPSPPPRANGPTDCLFALLAQASGHYHTADAAAAAAAELLLKAPSAKGHSKKDMVRSPFCCHVLKNVPLNDIIISVPLSLRSGN